MYNFTKGEGEDCEKENNISDDGSCNVRNIGNWLWRWQEGYDPGHGSDGVG